MRYIGVSAASNRHPVAYLRPCRRQGRLLKGQRLRWQHLQQPVLAEQRPFKGISHSVACAHTQRRTHHFIWKRVTRGFVLISLTSLSN